MSPVALVINGLLALLSVLAPPAAQGATQVTVDKDSYVLISSVRYSRFEFDYTYTAQAVNSGTTAAAMCTATLSSNSSHSVVLDGSLSFGAVPAGGRTTSNDTFTFRQDRQFAFDPNALSWQVQCVSVPTNTPPTANAGADQTTFAGSTVTLNGSASSDADGDPLTFEWTLTVRPAGSTATLANPTSVMPSFVADADGEYRAQLVVNDSHVNSTADVVIVTTIPQNTPPVANAGPDQTAFVADVVTLDGTASSDIDGDPLTFAWVFLARPAGSAAALAGAGTARPTFTPDVAGDYTIRLTVNDGRGGSNAASVLVTTQVRNRAPTANAGPDQVVVAGQTVHLDGTASSDPEGTPLAFAWTFASRPTGSTAVLLNATTATPSFVADRAGNFVVQLIVSDGQLFSVPDTALISTSNTPPVANAGPDQTVDPGTLVQLDGSASSDANNDPLAFLWSFTTRPAGSAATLGSAVIPNPTFVADRAGLYTVQLVVNDGRVDSAPDTVNITGRNRNPDAVDDSASTQTNVAATIPVLANDTDPDGDTLTVTAVTQPANGAVVNNGGSVTFTPAAGFSGTTTFTYTISDGHGGADTATVTVTVTALPVVTIVATDPNAAEAGLDPAVFTVSRTGATTAALTVSYTVAGTATNGTDYQTIVSSVAIAAGQSSATIAITPIDDTNNEPTETVVLTLVAQAAYTVGGANAATANIVDNDLPVVTVTASDASASEVGPDNGAFTISRSGDLSSALAVSLTLGGTAGNGADYSTISSPVTIAANQASVTVTVATLRDNLVEGSEIAILALSPNATVYTIGAPSSATVTIADSPAVVAVTASDANASETGPDNGVFTLTRSGGDTTASLPVSFTLTGTAANGTDYTSIASPVTIAANQTSVTVTLTPIADALVEGSETAILTISASASYSVGASPAATVTIADGALPVVTVNATDANAAEAGLDPGTFTVSRTGPTPNPLTVNFTIGGSAANGADYQTIAASATIGSGASTALVTITPIDDAVSEGGETVVVTLLADPNYSAGGANSATVTIADNDVAFVTVTATDASAAEAGADTGTFTFTRSGSTTLSLDNVTFNILGTAQNGVDYTSPSLPGAASGTVSFPAGQSAVTIVVTPLADQLVEGNETVILALTDGANYDLGAANSATVTIADAVTPLITVTAGDASASEVGPDTGAFTFTRSGSTTLPLDNVTFNILGIAQNGVDYTSPSLPGASSGAVSFPAGQAAVTIVVTPLADQLVEGGETVILALTDGANYDLGTPNSATVTIADAPTPLITIAATDANAAEAGADPGTFTLTRSGSTALPLDNVTFSIAGTAQNAVDYTSPGLPGAASGAVSFPAGQASVSITVTPIADALVEGNETAVLALIDGANYNLGAPSSATVTIADASSPLVTVTATDPNASEVGPDSGTFTFTRSGSTTLSLDSVSFNILGTAQNAVDYTSPSLPGASSGVVSFAAGQASVTVTVTPSADQLIEGSETVILALVDGANYDLGAPSTATVTIADNNQRPVANAGPDQTVFVVDTIQLNGSGSSDPESQPLTYQWSVASAPPTSAVNFSGQTIVSPTVTVSLPGTYVFQLIVNDANQDSLPDTVSVTVNPVPTLSINDVTVTEGNSGTTNAVFTVSISTAINRTVTASFTTANVSAVAPADYQSSAGTVTFAPSSTTAQSITVLVNGDTTNEPNETFNVNLSGPANATFAKATGIGTIQNDDAAVTIALSPTVVNLFTSDVALMTVTLNSPAPAGGQIVALASNNTAAVTVPANVTVLANQTTTTFQATATNTAGSAVITGSATGLGSGTATVNVANRGITVTLVNTLVGVGRTVGGTVTLSQPAPSGGVTINLVSGNTNFATVAPASVNIAQGATQASLTVSGVAVGSTGITASATGFAPSTATITVTNNLISIGAIPNVAPGQSLAFPVSLTQPAPAGGVTINFTSNTPGVATVTASVSVPAGQQTPAANPQITGVNIGTALISATATGFAPDSRNATVTVTLTLTPTTLAVTQGTTANATLTASAPAPATGLTISLSSSNTANFTVPATATIPVGQLSVLVPVTGVAVAAGQILTASAPGIAPATSTINITAAPAINFGNFSVGANLQESASGSLAQAAPPVTGVLVTVTSADPARLLLSTDPLVLGGASIQLAVAGNSASIPAFFLQALAGTGAVDITLSAPGYATRTSTITLQPSGFVELNQSTINTTTFSANTTLVVRSARLTPGTLNFAAAQPLRPAGLGLTLPVQVAVTSSNTNTGVIVTSPVAFGANVAIVNSAFDPLNAGTSTISIVPPAGFDTPGNFRQIAATVTAPNINGTVAIRVGANLEATLNPALSQAPPSPVDLTITSANTAVAVISNSAIALGGATVVFPNVANTATQPLVIQATGAPGTSTTLTLSATGFTTATMSVDIDPSGFVEINQTTINTTTFSANTTLTIRPARLTAGTLNFSAQQPLRPAGLGLVLPVQVAVTSSDTNTGVITASPVSFGANVDTVTTAFDPLNAGTSTINVVPPAGFSTPAGFRQIAATVMAPNINGTTTLRVGEDLQEQAAVNLSVTPPAPVTITVTSGNTAVAVVGTNATVLGGASITFAGVANTGGQTYFVQSTGTAGQTTNLTITAPGYNTLTIPVTIDPSGFVEINQATLSTTTFSANFPLVVRPARLVAGTLAFASLQSLRPAGLGLTLPVSVPVTSSDTNTGIITTSPLAFGANVATLNTAFDPLAAGTTTISIVPPAGFDTPANFRQIPATVTAPNINTQATVRVGEDLEQSATASLAVAPPNPVDMTLTVASTAVAVISSSATVLGSGALTFPAVANVSAQAFFVQAVGTAGQSTTVSINAPGYNTATMTVTIDPSGFVNINQGATLTTTVNAANSTLTVTPARLDPVTRNFAAQQPLRPAGLGLTLPVAVTVTSSNTTAGVITVSPLNFNANVNNVLTAFDPLAQGTSTVTYQTPAGFDTPNTFRQTVVTVNP